MVLTKGKNTAGKKCSQCDIKKITITALDKNQMSKNKN